MNNNSNKSTHRSKRQRDKRKREESNSSNNNNNEHNSSSRQRRDNTTSNDGSISNPQQPPQQSTTSSSVKHDSTNQQPSSARIGNESLLAYIKRICVPQIGQYMGFFTSARNKHQQSAFDKYKELCRKDLVTLSNDGGAQLPTINGGISGLSPVVHRTWGSGQVYLKAKPGISLDHLQLLLQRRTNCMKRRRRKVHLNYWVLWIMRVYH